MTFFYRCAFVVTLCASFLSCLPQKGHAKSFFLPVNTYVGLDYRMAYQGNSVPYINTGSDINVSISRGSLFHGFEPHVGMRFGPFLGVELGYMYSFSSNGEQTVTDAHGTQDNISAKLNFYGPFADVLGYIPLDGNGDFDLLGSLGVSLESANLAITDAGKKTNYSDTKLGGRFGIGAQYNMTDHVNIRVIGRYGLVSHNVSSAVPGNLVQNGFWSLNFGVNYVF